MNNAQLQQKCKPLFGLAMLGVVCAVFSGLLSAAIAGIVHTRGNPGDIALEVIYCLEDILWAVAGEQLYGGYLSAVIIIAALLLLPLCCLYFRFSNQLTGSPKAAFCGRIAAVSGLALIVSLIVAGVFHEDNESWLIITTVPALLAAITCAASTAMYILILLERAAALESSPIWPFLLAAVVSALCALSFLSMAILYIDDSYINIFFALPNLFYLYIAVLVSALSYTRSFGLPVVK
ncbi:MAG: hypothetical protein VB084_09200 [Syntrophomonadaceae bacterium]|nr:hypothetical protein [Syntrophomonadaceae bacterium]